MEIPYAVQINPLPHGRQEYVVMDRYRRVAVDGPFSTMSAAFDRARELNAEWTAEHAPPA